VKPGDKTSEIKKLLARRHSDKREWVYIHELPDGTGSECRGWIDGFAINCWHCNSLRRIAYEIKISRSDFLSELKFSEKRRSALLFSNEYYFVTPKDLVIKSELPLECGLIEWDGAQHLKTIVKAPRRAAHPPSWTLLAGALRTYGHQRWQEDRENKE